jgi:hypothetical protein
MSPDPGPFEAFYAGPLQHPGLLWIAALAGTAVAVTRRGLRDDVRRYCIGLGLLSLADAWLTTTDVPGLGSLPPALADVAPLFFVLAGDFRYLLLVTAGTAAGGLSIDRSGALAALALTLIVPLSTQLASSVFPEAMSRPRVMFLFYEASFFFLTLGLMGWSARVREIRWIRSVSRFVAVYYGLWGAADTLILATGADLGYLLRAVPNVLYYGGLIGVIGRCAASQSGDRASR